MNLRMDDEFSVGDKIVIDEDNFIVVAIGSDVMVLKITNQNNLNEYKVNNVVKINKLYYVVQSTTKTNVCLRFLEYSRDVLGKE